MESKDFTTSITVDATAREAFNSINQVSAWWTENLVGSSHQLNDEFTVQFGDVHVSTQKLVECIPDKRVVWLVTSSRLNFISNKEEWTGTKISFEIETEGDLCIIRFTHHGLVPAIECFGACSNAWKPYIQESLYSLITTRKGFPTTKEKNAAV